ncbi:MAG: PilW family protein [Candidatus Accumulibacter sp.]|jgi:type IV pilus assembly protein PilW|nr:PilW family protein [Accumulibacter sp.]
MKPQTRFPGFRQMLPRTKKSSHRGFSLVEIMVALVIGMIGVLVIMQVARTTEAQKRITTGTGESQNNGVLAIYAVQRDVRQAGYGLSSLNVLGCPLTVPARAPLPGYTLSVLAPVTINPPTSVVPAGDNGTDTLLVVHGNSASSPEGDTIVSVDSLGTRQRLGFRSAVSFRNDDWVVVAPPAPDDSCALNLRRIEVHGQTIDVPNIAAGAGETLFDLGDPPRIVAYAIRDGDLSACDYMRANCAESSNWTSIVNGIVSLRVQYGHDTGSPGNIDAWNQKAPNRADFSDPATRQEKFACAWARISAVRLALVARNGEWQRDEVTPSAPTWKGASGSSDNATPVPIDLSGNPDWSHYRYQVYETVMPLRNIPWMGRCSP